MGDLHCNTTCYTSVHGLCFFWLFLMVGKGLSGSLVVPHSPVGTPLALPSQPPPSPSSLPSGDWQTCWLRRASESSPDETLVALRGILVNARCTYTHASLLYNGNHTPWVTTDKNLVQPPLLLVSQARPSFPQQRSIAVSAP